MHHIPIFINRNGVQQFTKRLFSLEHHADGVEDIITIMIVEIELAFAIQSEAVLLIATRGLVRPAEETVVKGPEWRPVSDVRIVDPSPVSFLHDVAPANPEGIVEVVFDEVFVDLPERVGLVNDGQITSSEILTEYSCILPRHAGLLVEEEAVGIQLHPSCFALSAALDHHKRDN